MFVSAGGVDASARRLAVNLDGERRIGQWSEMSAWEEGKVD